MKRVLGVVLTLILAAPGAWAQITGGNIYGTVTDSSGAVLPGASITITSDRSGARTVTSGPQGEFRFLNLDPGAYKLAVALSGFGGLSRDVTINAGSNISISFPLRLASLAEAVDVSAEAPVIDIKKVGTSTTLTNDELTQTPQSRDPWAVLKTVPGVMVDRVSIAGNEAGQQSVFSAKGASPNDSVYTYDGIVITDSACGGCSSMYYDFDAFDQIKVDTGGNDLSVMTGGVGLNFVTKRGTNTFHATGRLYYSSDDKFYQGNNVPDSLKSDSRINVSTNPDKKADRIDRILDWGVDVSGPLVKDKLWFWAAFNKNDIGLIRIAQTKDQTLLHNTNAKLNWQASSNDMVSASYFYGKKEKFGRSPGYAGTEPDSILFDQGDFGPDFGPFSGLKGLFKIEDNHVFSQNFFMNAKYAYFGWGYGFDPRGGIDQSGGVDFTTDTAFGSSLRYRSLRPWHVVDVSGSYFKEGMGGNHELRFGFGYRANPVHSSTRYAGNGSVARNFGDGEGVAVLFRDRVAFFKGTNTDVYIGDTFTKGRMTLNAGLRYDIQKASNEASSAPAQRLLPDLFPGVTVDPSNLQGIEWKDVSPRVAVTYALDDARKTVARASYAQYAGQLNSFETTSNNAAGSYYPYVAYNWVDKNGDHLASRDELLINEGIQYSYAVDPNNLGSNVSPNQIDKNYKANKDREFIVGLDREVMENFAVGVAYTYRKGVDIPGWNPRLGLTVNDYTANAPVTVTTPQGTFVGQSFTPDAAKVAAGNAGRILTNRPDYYRTYNGLELSATKRLANKWMMRAAFAYMDWTEHFNGPNAFQNPTRTQNTAGGTAGGPGVEGGQVIIKSYGSKTDTFYNSKWQITASALYQAPWGIDLGASILGRQGYPFVVIMRLPAGDDGRPNILATPAVDTNRFDNLWDLDLRLAKKVSLGSKTALRLSVDLFNVLNADTVLQRARTVNASSTGGINGSFNRVNELINPRVARIGVRLEF